MESMNSKRANIHLNSDKQVNRSLRARVAVGVALPIFIVLAFLSFFNYYRNFQLLDEQARLDAVQLGDLMIHSLNHAMLTKEGEHLLTSIEDVSQLENVQNIQIIGISGEVMADSSGQESKRNFNLGDAECQACHKYTSEERPRVIPLEKPSEGWRISAPVNNLPQCHECHDPSLSHLGVLLMDISLTGKQAHLLGELEINLLISGVSTGLVSLMSYALIHRLVVRRIEKFRKPLAEYANGKFDIRMSKTSNINDELCELADTFNKMADELEKHAIEDRERQKFRERAIIEERERIARELHDGFAQELGYVNTKVMAVRLLVKKQKLKDADQQLEHLESAAKGLFVDVREAILGLKIAGRNNTNLIEALDEYIQEFRRLSGIPTVFKRGHMMENLDLKPEIELHLVRIVQEALNNIRKHSGATQAWVKLSNNTGQVSLEIKDNGVGFDYNKLNKIGSDRLGLSNMKERATEVGAEFQIVSIIEEGTSIMITLPLVQREFFS